MSHICGNAERKINLETFPEGRAFEFVRQNAEKMSFHMSGSKKYIFNVF